jgi:lipopolysaccharide/colanic/teichoic acid biosynthesis glycosyltransferase
VGPRPTSFGPETYQLWHTERLDVAPGLTGLWQIIGRAQLEFDDRLRLDIAYIERRSIWFDANILLQTILAINKQVSIQLT